MGTSLYDQFVNETKSSAPSLYDQYLSETKRSKPSDINNQATPGELAAANGSGLLGGAARHVLNTAQGIPGMEAVEAAFGTGPSEGRKGMDVTPGLSYRESLAALRSQTGRIGGKTAMAERIVGSLPLMAAGVTAPIVGAAGKLSGVGGAIAKALIPTSAVAKGALIGGANEALDADPNHGVLRRAIGTAGGALAGGVLGKGAEMAGTGIRALASKTPAANLFTRLADQAQSAKQLYSAANAEGRAHEATPAIRAFVQDEEIAPIVQELQATTHQGKAAESPEMLDAIYKTLTDKAKAMQKGLDAPSPNRINTGRFRLQGVTDLKQRLLDAVSSPGTKTTEVPALETAQSPHPSTTDALDAFRERSGEAARRAVGGAQPNTNPFSSQASGETFAQRKAREILERSGAENIVSPALSGAPSPKTITTDLPAFMPSYKVAVADYAKKAAGMDALKTARAIATKRFTGGNVPSNALTKMTPEALAEMVGNPRNAENLPAMREGILGAVKEQGAKGLSAGRKAVGKAPELLRLTQDPKQAAMDDKIRQMLIALNASRTP